MVTEKRDLFHRRKMVVVFRIAADAGAFRCTAWKADAGGFGYYAKLAEDLHERERLIDQGSARADIG